MMEKDGELTGHAPDLWDCVDVCEVIWEAAAVFSLSCVGGSALYAFRRALRNNCCLCGFDKYFCQQHKKSFVFSELNGNFQ